MAGEDSIEGFRGQPSHLGDGDQGRPSSEHLDGHVRVRVEVEDPIDGLGQRQIAFAGQFPSRHRGTRILGPAPIADLQTGDRQARCHDQIVGAEPGPGEMPGVDQQIEIRGADHPDQLGGGRQVGYRCARDELESDPTPPLGSSSGQSAEVVFELGGPAGSAEEGGDVDMNRIDGVGEVEDLVLGVLEEGPMLEGNVPGPRSAGQGADQRVDRLHSDASRPDDTPQRSWIGRSQMAMTDRAERHGMEASCVRSLDEPLDGTIGDRAPAQDATWRPLSRSAHDSQRLIVSTSHTGSSEPSAMTTMRMTTWAPPGTSVQSRISPVPRMWEPIGTGVPNRTRSEP